MSEAERFQRMADELFEVAGKFDDPTHRAEYLALARTWRALAQQLGPKGGTVDTLDA